MPTGNKAISVDAGEEAGQVLVVDLWCRVGIEVSLFQELDKFKDVSFGKVVWKSHWHHLVKELGDAVQHRSKWGCKEADNRSTREKVLLPFG